MQVFTFLMDRPAAQTQQLSHATLLQFHSSLQPVKLLLPSLQGMLCSEEQAQQRRDELCPLCALFLGKGHIRGTIHHGAVGLALQSIAYLAGMAEVASQAAKSYEIEEELHEIAAEFEQLAYPSKT